MLELNNVSYQYANGAKKVLKGITVKFTPGKLYCIMGKSGAGKSTVLSLISGLDICSDGEILYNGKNIKEIDRDNYRAKSIGVIFQSFNLIQNTSAMDNILLSMNISKSKVKNKKEFAYHLLERVGIDKEKADRKILQLSGGEQQRIGIARALAHNPNVIIADEPTGNLDEETEKRIMTILSDLAHKENKCVIIVTHSKQVARYADELWGLNQGNLVFVK